jgi:hypothetical protein
MTANVLFSVDSDLHIFNYILREKSLKWFHVFGTLKLAAAAALAIE